MTGQILVNFFSVPSFISICTAVSGLLNFYRQTDRQTDRHSDLNKRFAGMRTPFILAGIACSDVCTSGFPHSPVSITRTTAFYHANFAIVKY